MNSMKLAAVVSLSLLAAACGGGGDAAPAAPVASLGDVLDADGNVVASRYSTALAVNGANEVVGFAAVAPGAPLQGVLWKADPSGKGAAPARLAPLPGNAFSAAFAVDAGGSAVGISRKGAALVAVRWPAGSAVPAELPALSAGRSSAAFGVTSEGDAVVGEAEDATGATRAVVWRAGATGAFGPPVPLPVNVFHAAGASATYASAIGVARVGGSIWVVGEVEDGAGKGRAALWRSDAAGVFTATDLHAGERRSIAWAVNRAGVVAGEAETSRGVHVPSTWTVTPAGVTRTSLGASGGAVAVNDAGHVAGWDAAGGTATVWETAGGAAPLVGGARAQGINDAGVVVGQQGDRAFLTRAR